MPRVLAPGVTHAQHGHAWQGLTTTSHAMVPSAPKAPGIFGVIPTPLRASINFSAKNGRTV